MHGALAEALETALHGFGRATAVSGASMTRTYRQLADRAHGIAANLATMLLPCMTSPKQAEHIIFLADDRTSAKDAVAVGLVSRVVALGTHAEEALRAARGIALMDPNLVAETKKARNRTYKIQRMSMALNVALDVDYTIKSHGPPDRRAFMDIAREQGIRHAIAWRDTRFAKEKS